jgi:Phosphoenolpyruvate carboxykinase
VRSGTAIALSFAERTIVIAGTEYAGEIKKSIFTVMNWRLPETGVLPMHCSANIGPDRLDFLNGKLIAGRARDGYASGRRGAASDDERRSSQTSP